MFSRLRSSKSGSSTATAGRRAPNSSMRSRLIGRRWDCWALGSLSRTARQAGARAATLHGNRPNTARQFSTSSWSMAANRPGETAVAAGPAAIRQSQSRWSLDMEGSRVKAVVLGSYSENVTSACAVSLRTFESAIESGLVERGAAVVAELVDETRGAVAVVELVDETRGADVVVELVDEAVVEIVVSDVVDVVDVDTVVVDVGLKVVERVVVEDVVDVVVEAVLELALLVDRVLEELSRSTTEGFAVVVELEEIIAEPSVETSWPNVVLIFSASNCSSVRLRSDAASPNNPVKCWIIRT